MSISAGDKTYNIRLSFNKAIADNLRDEGGILASIPVNYDDDKFDTSGLNRWIKIQWIDDSMMEKSERLCQISIITRDDNMGLGMMKLFDLFMDCMRSLNNGFEIYDFNVITAPITTGRNAMIDYLRPAREVPTTEAGIREYILTLRIFYGMHLY